MQSRKAGNKKKATVLYGATVLGASFFNADLRWLTGFSASDPFVAVVHGDGRVVVFMSRLEYERARREARADEVVLLDALFEKYGLENNASRRAWLSRYLKEQGVIDIEVSGFFRPVLRLTEEFSLAAASGPLFPERAKKKKDEIAAIKRLRDITETLLLRHRRGTH